MSDNRTIRVPHKKYAVCTAPICTELAKSVRRYVPSFTPIFHPIKMESVDQN
jgi:hypothetical protein